MNVIPPQGEKTGQHQGDGEAVLLTATAGQDVVVAEAWFLKADFDREGPDLVIKGPDGEHIVVRDYFNQPDPPDIRTPDGVVLKGETATVLAGPRVSGQQYAQAQEIAQVAPIGTVETIEGAVSVTRVDGTVVQIQVGDAVYQGDVIETANAAAVGIVFQDESTFSLGEGGRMVLDEMIYDPAAQTGQAGISLLQGAFTFVSGQIAKTGVDAMVVDTPTATIGIRGTAGGGNVNGDGSTTAALISERAGFVGEMTISNGFGVQVINQPNQAVNVFVGQPPSEPFAMSPRQIAETFGNAFSALPRAGESLDDNIRQQVEDAYQELRDLQDQAEQGDQAAADEFIKIAEVSSQLQAELQNAMLQQQAQTVRLEQAKVFDVSALGTD